MKTRFLVTIPFFVCCFLATASADYNLKTKYERERKKATQIYKQLQERKKQVSLLTWKEREILSALGEVENRIDRQNARLEDLTQALKQKTLALSQMEQDLRETEGDVHRLKEQARRRLAAYYKLGTVGLMNVVFSSCSLPDLFNRREALRFMLRKDQEAVSIFQSKIDKLSQVRQEILASNQALQQLKEKIQIEASALENLRQEKADLLSAVCRQKKDCLLEIRELQQAAETLNATIQALQQKIEQEAQQKPNISLSRGFAAQKGKLNPPVRGKVVGLFGRVRRSQSGATIIRNGIDIQAPTGTEIRSIYAGRVIYVGNLKGYGNIFILDHGDKYYSLYSHVSKFFKEVGSLVKKGETIGLLGDAGSSLEQFLYFEIRHGGKPENPLAWIDVAKLSL